MPILYLLAGGLLVVIGAFMGYRMGQGKPPVEISQNILPIINPFDDMPGPFRSGDELEKKVK